jgi:hypothetical protein
MAPTRDAELAKDHGRSEAGRARNLMMEWFYFIVRLRLERAGREEVGQTNTPHPSGAETKKENYDDTPISRGKSSSSSLSITAY